MILGAFGYTWTIYSFKGHLVLNFYELLAVRALRQLRQRSARTGAQRLAAAARQALVSSTDSGSWIGRHYLETPMWFLFGFVGILLYYLKRTT